MGSHKAKAPATTTTTTTTPAKAPPEAPPPPPASVPLAAAYVSPEWSASFQAFYGRGVAAVMPHAFYSPSPVAGGQTVVWGPQQMMSPYGSPIAYAPFYPHGGFYAQPPVNAGMVYPTPETEGRPPEQKGQHPENNERFKDGEGSPEKLETDEDATQSDDTETERSSDTKENDDQFKGHSPTRNRSYGSIDADGGTPHPLSIVEYSGANAQSSYNRKVRTAKKLPVSAPGRAALPIPQANLNFEMNFYGASHAGSIPMKTGWNGMNSRPVTGGHEKVMYEENWTQDDCKLRREKRKQSNRESARRSRLRKQKECEDLARTVTDLSSENSSLRLELERHKQLCGKLEIENRKLTEELEQVHRSDLLPIKGTTGSAQ